MQYEIYRLVIRCLLRKARRLKREQLRRIAIAARLDVGPDRQRFAPTTQPPEAVDSASERQPPPDEFNRQARPDKVGGERSGAAPKPVDQGVVSPDPENEAGIKARTASSVGPHLPDKVDGMGPDTTPKHLDEAPATSNSAAEVGVQSPPPPLGPPELPEKQCDESSDAVPKVAHEPSALLEPVFCGRIHSPPPRESFPQTFVIESFFARELITILTRGRNEEMHFLTGPKIGPIRIVCRWARPVSLERQTPVFVGATARSVADVLIPIIEQGAELHVCAHSHPGGGPGATTPSGTDVQCLGKLQRSGSEAIGCIVTRDGHLRFFSISTTFHALVLGAGVKEIAPNVFHIAHQDRH